MADLLVVSLEGVDPALAGLRAIGGNVERALDRGLERAGQRGTRILAGNTPRSANPGPHLADSFVYQLGGSGTDRYVDLQTELPERLRWLREGTRPHTIRATGRALRFSWPGGPAGPGLYFFRSVNHPGTQPNDVVAASLDQIREAAVAELTIALQQEADQT